MPRTFPLRLLLSLVLLLSTASGLQAQTVDGRFQVQINPGAGTGGADQFEVTVELKGSSAFNLGTSTLMFTFNESGLSIPSAPAVNDALQAGTDYAFIDPFIDDVGSGKFYQSSTVTLFGQTDRLSVNVVLDLAGNGQEVATSYTPVVQLFFDIDDAAQTSMLAWILPSSGDANPTVIQEEDNATAVSVGSFSDDDSTLPVELVSFEAVQEAEAVVLEWATASETNNAGFEVERSVEGFGFEQIGYVEGRGTTTEPQAYGFTDAALPFEAEQLRYRLKQVDFDGSFAYSPVVEAGVATPEQFQLYANYPNPFNPRTTIRYALPRSERVRLVIYDVLGREVEVLVDGPQAAGRHAVVFEARDRPSGTYVYRLQAGGQIITRKMMLTK